MRLTKIICTLGPASKDRETIVALAKAGMNVARINFSHGTQEQHGEVIRLVHAINAEEGLDIGILLDTQGAEIRTGELKEPVLIKRGQEIAFSPHPIPGETRPVIHVNYDGFANDVRSTDRIILDNGELIFEIVEIRKDGSVVAKAGDDGKIGSRRHVNLPGADIDLPSITEKDWSDLAFGVEQKMHYTALSFIRTPAEVESVRAFLRKKKSDMKIISKIEAKQAVENIDGIIAASDGIMIARGDLGAEIDFALIPAIQDSIVLKCRAAGKPVIVATHMLESMILHPMPTRAEATDVAHAAMTRADATMLSGETASGKHPVTALQAMDRILRETEAHLTPEPMPAPAGGGDEHRARAQGAVTMATALDAAAIVVITRSGKTAKMISALRPSMPVFALTEDKAVLASLQLDYAVRPRHLDLSDDPEDTVERALKAMAKDKLLPAGARVVIVSDAKTKKGSISTVQVRPIG